jgi:hypothetical protein
MVRVSADNWTKEQLGIKEEEITEDHARKICEKLIDNKNYKLGLSQDKLIIQRYIRD